MKITYRRLLTESERMTLTLGLQTIAEVYRINAETHAALHPKVADIFNAQKLAARALSEEILAAGAVAMSDELGRTR